MGYSIMLPAWWLVPTVAFLFAPMLNDVVFHYRRMRKRDLLRYLGQCMLLYGSMVFITLKSAFTSAFNGSVFVTTPKEETKVSFRSALVASRGEIVFGLGLGLVAIALTGSVLPVLLLVVPALASVYLGTMHNRMAPGGRWRRAM